MWVCGLAVVVSRRMSWLLYVRKYAMHYVVLVFPGHATVNVDEKDGNAHCRSLRW